MDDRQLVMRQVVAQPRALPGKVRHLAETPARRIDQPFALEAGARDELTMRRVVLEAAVAGHDEHDARDAARVRGIEEPPGGDTGIGEVLEHVAAEQRLETPGSDPRQVRRVGIGP